MNKLDFYLFHLMPYPFIPPGEEIESTWVTLSNSHYDPKVGHRLYNEYLEQLIAGERFGYDGVCVNEHHQNAYGTMPAPDLMAAYIAAKTERIPIGIIGNALPLHGNPLRVAEEIAMLDVISGGRIISGFVHGTGMEYHSYGSNPSYSQERFWEAHDLIIKAWTQPGPFHWQGKHYNLPYVNPWPRPLQQPHPPIWITGSSLENVPWVADHQYTFACFLTPYELTEALVNTYRERCRQQALPEPGSDKFAYLALCYTAETDEQAEEDGKGLLWYLYRERHPYFNAPPGYVSAPAMAKAALGVGGKPYRDSFEGLQEKGIVIAGSPDTMIKKIKYLHERCGIGHLLMMNQAGFMPADKVRRSMELFAKEAYPAIRELGVQPRTPEPAAVG